MNIGLDLLFVVVLKMEVAGAALATILSQLLSAALVMWTLMRTKESFRFELKHLKVDKPMLRKIIQIGFPAGLQSVLYSISNVVIQANINSFGTNVIAAWAVYGKVDGLFWMIMDAMGIAITTFAGQNFGARKYERMQKGHYVGLGITTIPTAILAAGVMLFGSILGSLFTSDPDVLAEKYDHHPVRNAVLVQLYLCKRIFQYSPGHRRHVYPHAADLLRHLRLKSPLDLYRRSDVSGPLYQPGQLSLKLDCHIRCVYHLLL